MKILETFYIASEKRKNTTICPIYILELFLRCNKFCTITFNKKTTKRYIYIFQENNMAVEKDENFKWFEFDEVFLLITRKKV